MGRRKVIDWKMVEQLRAIGLTWQKVAAAIDYGGHHGSLATNYRDRGQEKVSAAPFKPQHAREIREYPDDTVTTTPLVTGWCDYSPENIPDSEIPNSDKRHLRRIHIPLTQSTSGCAAAMCAGV